MFTSSFIPSWHFYFCSSSSSLGLSLLFSLPVRLVGSQPTWCSLAISGWVNLFLSAVFTTQLQITRLLFSRMFICFISPLLFRIYWWALSSQILEFIHQRSVNCLVSSIIWLVKEFALRFVCLSGCDRGTKIDAQLAGLEKFTRNWGSMLLRLFVYAVDYSSIMFVYCYCEDGCPLAK